jgi:hypothetical protein
MPDSIQKENSRKRSLWPDKRQTHFAERATDEDDRLYKQEEEEWVGMTKLEIRPVEDPDH